LGAGLGLLLADRLSDEQRRAVGWKMFLFGAVSTIPLAFEVLCKGHADRPEQRTRSVELPQGAS
jgi:hypothetical protein